MLLSTTMSNLQVVISAFPRSRSFYAEIDLPAKRLLEEIASLLIKHPRVHLILALGGSSRIVKNGSEKLFYIGDCLCLQLENLPKEFLKRLMFADIGKYNTRRFTIFDLRKLLLQRYQSRTHPSRKITKFHLSR